MKRTAVGAPLLFVVVVAGCAHRLVAAPSPQVLHLGTLQAAYRDYSQVRVCDVDPTPLSGELVNLNRVLAQFLDSTSAGVEGQWSTEQLQSLGTGAQVLPPFLDLYELELHNAQRCDFPAVLGMADTLAQGMELARQARSRVAEAPALLTRVRAHQALEAAREAQARERAIARQQTCRSRGRRPELYYALEDAGGRREFLFCDGTRALQATAGEPPSFTSAQGGPLKAKASWTQLYLTAIHTYPEGRIHHALPAEAPQP